MNIVEVTKEAMSKGRGITRESWLPNSMLLIPTNTIHCFIGETSDGKLIGKWQPCADDIVADDWIVYG
ncbi:MW1434 family type I TA system toxin [Carnobacterium sp.]|uniref:Thoeris anti-defense Tad2 family protein n=1 Tax=Carnobacterium sp. TaxID=48221 RepID=UPI003890DB7D